MSTLRNLFVPHGSFTIDVSPQRLLVDAKGPFNVEVIAQYESAIESAIRKLEGKPWTQIIILRGMSMLTLEAESRLEKVVLTRQARGMFASAVVFIEAESKSIVTQQIQEVYKRTNTVSRFFDRLSEAESWLDTLSPEKSQA